MTFSKAWKQPLEKEKSGFAQALREAVYFWKIPRSSRGFRERKKITLRRKVILVGVTGLEPAASTSQTNL